MLGSSEKKRNASGTKEGAKSGEGIEPALLKFLITMKNDLIESTREAVGRIETRIDRMECRIESLEKRVENVERELGDRIASEVAKQVAGAATAPPSVGPRSKREVAYNFYRRSLKLWPVGGEDLEDAVRQFLKTKLGLTDRRIQLLGSIEVSALPGRAAGVRKEVLATFECKEDRDAIKTKGINLAGQREVGMSIHVPGYLLDNLVALNGLGYSIKQKNPETKRSVKFDDSTQNLYLDICIGDKWKRIGPEEAKQVLKEVPSANSSSMSISLADITNLIRDKTDE